MQTFSIDPHRLEELLNYCTDFAKTMIAKHGEFYPFGAVIAATGQLEAIGGHAGENPQPSEVYGLLLRGMRSQFLKNEIIGAAIAANVNVPPQYQPPFPDGIRVLLECSGYSRFIYLPYRLSNQGVRYGEFITVEVNPSICTP